ncbi:hypothetical protein RB195_005492 [Necator americanus]|uniref:Reverse transcriptase domain-containing protein n=1 Tax=Necator americanus TaxID=51031 RepID=A0ABR1BN45_NECAM
MRGIVDQCPTDIILAPSGCPLTDLEYADDVVIFAESSTKLQHVVNLVSKLAAAYGLRLRHDKCKQMWISSRPRTGIRVDGQPIELVDEFCYLGCTLKNNGSYERDVQQRCAKATSAFNSLTKCLWSTPITNEVKLRVYLSAIRSIMMYGSETWAAPSTVMERLDCTERKLLRRLLGYFWPRVCHNEDLYADIDVVYRRMTHGRHQNLAPPSKVAKVNRLRFFGHILRRPADRLVQRVLRSSSSSSWKKPPGRKRKFWTEVAKEDLRTLGVDRQFRRDVRFRKIWNSDEWTNDSVQALAEYREGWAELCSRTAHLGEDADTDRQLEKFREAQSAVRLNKEKLDKLKVDTLQKVDLLSASRSNLLSHLLGKYLQMLCAYYEKTCRAYTALSANLSTFQHYEFEILTDLIEPSKKVAKKLRQESMDKEKKEYSQLPAVEPEEEAVGNLVDFDEEPAGSLKKYLFGRESPVDENNQEPEEERPESPLGVPENEPDAKKIETEQLNKIYIGPLPTLIDTEAEVPLLAPPPRAVPFQTHPSCSASKPFSLLTDTSGYSVQDLFPLVEKKKQDSDQGSIVDLLGAPSSQFPNPFEENKTTEWDLLLSQCDIQQSNDLI